MPPAFVLSLILVLLSGFAFHALWGQSARGLAATLVAALTGFVVGETVARVLAHHSFMVGPIHMVHGLVGTWLGMFIARYRSP